MKTVDTAGRVLHTLELTLVEISGGTEAMTESSGQCRGAPWSANSPPLQVEMSQQVHKGGSCLQNILPPT